MRSAQLTVDPAGLPQGTGWVDVDVTGSALDPLTPGTAVVINPIADVNITAVGLALVRIKDAQTLRVGVKLLNAATDFLFSAP